MLTKCFHLDVRGWRAVELDDRTIRSRAAIVVSEPHVARVAFDSGDILMLSRRSALGVIDPPVARAPRAG